MWVTKMEGLGNDYVYVRPEEEQDWSALAREFSDRHFSFGGDGLIVALPSDVADLRMRIFNADGSEAEMCGNGIRCLAKYAVEEGMVPADAGTIAIETIAGVLTVQLHREDGVVVAARVDMGPPSFDPASLPADIEGPGPIVDYPLKVDGMELRLTLASMGNPHAIHWLDSDVENFPLERIGPLVEHHPLFPNRTNFQVVQVVNREHVRHRVWERGTGITLASGTSASAVCAAGHITGRTGHTITDSLPGGDLQLSWDGEGSVFMTGPAERVFDTEVPAGLVFERLVAEHLDQLGTAIGLPLQTADGEVEADGARLDILARTVSDSRPVVIEVKMEVSRRAGVDQLLSYLRSLEGSIGVLVARDFSEHALATLRWLNESLGSRCPLFAVRARALRTGELPRVPAFEVLVSPTQAQKR